MTNSEKNKWLTEKILGEKLHINIREDTYYCLPNCSCGFEAISFTHWIEHLKLNPDFYSSNEDEQAINFFRLFNVINEKGWFDRFLISYTHVHPVTESKIPRNLINCSTLADAIGEYFGWEEVR